MPLATSPSRDDQTKPMLAHTARIRILIAHDHEAVRIGPASPRSELDERTA